MSLAASVAVRFRERTGTLRTACLRGGAPAVRAVLRDGGVRGATVLAWIAVRARPGTDLAARINAASVSAARHHPEQLVEADDAALLSFTRGLAIADAAGSDRLERARMLARWIADDQVSLLDFAVVATCFDLLEPAALLSVLDALDRPRPDDEATGGEMALLLSPRVSRRVLGTVASARPELMVRAIRRRIHADALPGRRGVELLAALAGAHPARAVDEAGRTATGLLARLVRGRWPGVDMEARLRGLQALAGLGWSPAVSVAIEELDAGLAMTGEAEAPRPAPPPTTTTRVARALLTILVEAGTDAALSAAERVGRRHPIAEVRRDALSLLRSRGTGRPGHAVALAREQLRDPDATIAMAAISHLAAVLPPAACGRALLRAVPDMPRPALRRAATMLPGLLPSPVLDVAVRRMVDRGDGHALLVLAAIAGGPGPQCRLFDADAGPDLAEIQRGVEHRLAAIHRLRTSEEEQVRPGRIRCPRLDPEHDPEADMAAAAGTGMTAEERRIVRVAAHHWITGRAAHRLVSACSRMAVRRAMLGGDAEDPSPWPQELALGMVTTLLRLLGPGAEAVDLRTRLLRTAILEGTLEGVPAMMALSHVAAAAPTIAEGADRTRGLWRHVARRMEPKQWAMAVVCARGAALLRTHPLPEPYAETVASALEVEPAERRAMLCHLPAATIDASFDRRFPEAASGDDSARPGAGAARRRPTRRGRSNPTWARMVRMVDSAYRRLAVEGNALLGTPVRVLPARDNAGYTSPPRLGQTPVIHVSPDPILDLGEAGIDVVLGVGLHELGHQLHDYREPGWRREAARIARLDLHVMQNLICDERLERRLRSHDVRYGRMIDAAINHHFHRGDETVPLQVLATISGRDVGELRMSIAAGRLPGRLRHQDAAPEAPADAVCVRRRDLVCVPGLATPWQVFMWALRSRADRRDVWCPRARAALDLVPRTLRHLDLRQIGGLCERLAEALGGVEAERARREAMRRLAETDAAVAALLQAVAAMASAGRPDPMGGAGQLPGPPDAASEHGDDDAGAAGREDETIPSGSATAVRVPVPVPVATPATNWGGNLDASEDYTPLQHRREVPRDAAAHRELVASIASHVAILRRGFARLGRREVDEPATRHGHRLDVGRARRLAAGPRLDVLVGRREETVADCELGILIDRSGSMHGRKIDLARRFGVLVAEAARGHRGISGWTAAFDDGTWYELGPFSRTSIASLEAGGGNNDAAALAAAGERLRRSRRRNRVLVLISDGEPTESTVAAFHAVAHRLERDHGIAVVHVVIDQIARHAVLPRYVDLSQSNLDGSVRAFAGLLVGLVRRGGRAVVARPPSSSLPGGVVEAAP